MEPTNLRNLRINYDKFSLLEENVPNNPLELFKNWFNEVKSDELEPNKMVLSTVDLLNAPQSRIVLLKEIDNGFVFFTNYESNKARELANNNKGNLLFFWESHQRQVRINGIVEKISEKDSTNYFVERPLDSRIGAMASMQSRILKNRKILEDNFTKIKNEVGENPPKPDYWGGYRLIPNYFEFWQGRPSRLHDRLVYKLEENNWNIFRLYP